MAGPGSRPFECVKRAWHSHIHQSIRGSIIQHIFRVVSEAHSSTTRNNREWQEKLPRVVLKAEEIMYSKANSEAEYVDTDTLWDRLNDAIDTIIRRDESSEVGQFLQPCIEAALVLGCVPVKTSRSQRHVHQRNYLTPGLQETAQVSPTVPNKTNDHISFLQPQSAPGYQLSRPRSTTLHQASSFAISSTQIAPQTSPQYHHQSFPLPLPSVATDSMSSLNIGSIYPLYYNSHFSNNETRVQFNSVQYPYCNNIILGRPVGWPGTRAQSAHPTFFSTAMRDPLPTDSGVIKADKNDQVIRPFDSHAKTVETNCDLSLRLGPIDCCVSPKRYLDRANNDGGSSSHPDLLPRNLELSFFPRPKEVIDNNKALRKRKAEDYHELGDERDQWLPKLEDNQFDGRYRW
ncbi:uncharacterized protein LOC141606033 [Silene latifolia]|uniref:uncharacterized protein LOC141606033 n=1 Tax=Silene latifolia TaxID=37657 RepID=UPI003D77AE89